jgi:Ca2+-binding RTX toxin-like protein
MPFERIVLPNSTATIQVTYDPSFPPENRAAVQTAIDIWATLVVSPVPIKIMVNWVGGKPANNIASAASLGSKKNFDNALKDINYPIALANSLANRDLDSENADIKIDYNKDYSGNADIISTILHELGHGLGLSSSIMIDESTGSPVQENTSRIYSQFIRNGSGQFLADKKLFPSGSAALREALTSDDLFFDFPAIRSVNNNKAAKIHAPAKWKKGSSISHLDEDTYNNTIDELMTPSIDSEIIRQPGPIVFRLFQAMGWKMNTEGWIYGTFNDEILRGTSNSQNIFGLEGSDTIYAGDSNDALYGCEGDDSLYGENGNDILDGGEGKDTLIGGAGADTLDGGEDLDTASYATSTEGITASLANFSVNTGDALGDKYISIENLTGSPRSDILVGNNRDNVITGFGGGDQLFGNAGDDTLIGDDGADTLDGGSEADKMIGKGGDDRYYIDSPSDTIIEDFNEGNDSVFSTITYTLGDNLENLTLTGSAHLAGRGNSQDNLITGNIGDNFLYGGDGSDGIAGGDGDDSLYGENGTDYLFGGNGNDKYYIDSNDDFITELPSEGDSDTVHTSASYTLGDNLENLILLGLKPINGTGNIENNGITGNNAINILNGQSGNDTLYGNGGNDTLLGGEENDVLIGGLDSDILNGGNGNDTASYFTALSSIIANLTNPQTNTGEAQGDTYISIENLIGSQFNDSLTGDTQANTLWGLDGNDIIDGLQGADIMVGGLGNDTYNLENLGDITIEGLNEGIDTVNAFINCTLASNLDNLFLIEGSTAIVGNGNDLDNLIFGNTSNNTLDGGIGNDTLYGGLGLDTLIGGLGNDRFVFNSIREKGDTILDFMIGNDQLVLTEMMRDMGYRGSNPIGEGFISARQVNAGLTALMVDPDGFAGKTFALAPFAFLNNVSASALLNNPNNFII